jgi:uncharacterized protein (DUF885 family)
MLRNPEAVTTAGLSAMLDIRNDQLTNISDAYIRETQSLEVAIRNMLQDYDRAKLTPKQQLTYDVYAWYLDDRIQGHQYMYCDYPVNPFITSVHYDLRQFLTDVQPVTNLQDARDYLTRLSQVGVKFDQLIDGLKRRESAGVILPRFLFSDLLVDLNGTVESSPLETPFYTAFETKVNTLSGVSTADKKALLEQAEREIITTVQPAHKKLLEYMQHLQTIAKDSSGVWSLPGCDGYYAYLLHHNTTTDLTAEQVHEIGLQQLELIHKDLRAIFDKLGYPADENLQELSERVVEDGEEVPQDQILSTYETIIKDADNKVGVAFNLRPKDSLIVKGNSVVNYYYPPAADGSRPGVFYAVNTNGPSPRCDMQTIAYHETIPGHHFQVSIANHLDLPLLRKAMDFQSYLEGWGLYAERLASELGFYKDYPYGDIARLQLESFRAARLVVDTGIHTMQWTPEQAMEFMLENVGRPYRGEIYRYIILPGQATAYDIGLIKMLELRQKAREELGGRFELKEYHDLILSSGPLPLELLEKVVESYIASKGG